MFSGFEKLENGQLSHLCDSDVEEDNMPNATQLVENNYCQII